MHEFVQLTQKDSITRVEREHSWIRAITLIIHCTVSCIGG